MKEKILELRASGCSYNEICKRLGCSKSTVSFHCGIGQKEKTKERLQKRRNNAVILNRVDRFQKMKSVDFQRVGRAGKRNITFTWKDVVEKFGWETNCYLTGEPIDLRKTETYEFDHIVPKTKGGLGIMDNLGISSVQANRAKAHMTVDELLEVCAKILLHHGYEVRK